mmetsp:Transcript_24728/g.40943  ORF Transcript_24728/g.40943 Transcript_24728/m.40943 type:complete len:162 (+) Transcript_24728:928-1413(+)
MMWTAKCPASHQWRHLYSTGKQVGLPQRVCTSRRVHDLLSRVLLQRNCSATSSRGTTIIHSFIRGSLVLSIMFVRPVVKPLCCDRAESQSSMMDDAMESLCPTINRIIVPYCTYSENKLVLFCGAGSGSKAPYAYAYAYACAAVLPNLPGDINKLDHTYSI